MPKPTTHARSETYVEHLNLGRAIHERNDCAVRAVAAATGQAYDYVHGLFAAHGRKARKGTQFSITQAVLSELGMRLVGLPPAHFIDSYPGHHRTALRSVTTHHPDRFPAAWQDGHTYLVFTTGHVLAVVNGVNHDWTRGRALRAKSIFKVVAN